MRGVKAKRIRKKVYTATKLRDRLHYKNPRTGEVRADDVRQLYQHIKKGKVEYDIG